MAALNPKRLAIYSKSGSFFGGGREGIGGNNDDPIKLPKGNLSKSRLFIWGKLGDGTGLEPVTSALT